MIGIDVDGTLLGASGVVAPVVWQAAQRARVAGIHLVLCSGRPAFGHALEYAERLEAEGWHAFQNGASVVHVGAKESRSTPLPGESVAALIKQARATGEVLELYNDREYVTESTSDWAREHAKLLGVPFAPRPFESLQPPIVRAQWLLSETRAAQVMHAQVMHEPHPQLEIAQSTSPLMPHTRFVGLTHQGISKGSAIRTIAAEYRIDLREAMYVGDAGNDLSALTIVGWPVAMANADPAVLKVAVRTVGHVDAGGLAQALEFAIESTHG